MPKIPSIPRISIVVPLGADVQAFETTLISVLENQPRGSEVVVAHDGQYDDPFDLSNEVRFVSSSSSSLVDLISASAATTRATYIGVMSPGFRAIDDWTGPAMDQFDQGAASVAPVIRDEAGRIAAAGWTETSSRLCTPNGAGQTKVGRDTSRNLVGSYLQAGFWRRDVLRSVISAFDSSDAIESTYAFAHMAKQAGWHCALASGSSVVTSHRFSEIDPPSLSRGRTLRAIRKAVTRKEHQMPSVANVLRSIFSPASLAETIGQATYRGSLPAIQRKLQLDQVLPCQDQAVIPMRTTGSMPIRRAA